MKKVLFICTGNIFRSVSAEYLLRLYFEKKQNNNFIVSSAGTKGNNSGIHKSTIESVKKYGGNISLHKYVVATKELVNDANIIICMSKHHVNFLHKQFGVMSYLFNELAFGEKTDLKDDNESFGEYKHIDEFISQTIDRIHEGIPFIYLKLINL